MKRYIAIVHKDPDSAYGLTFPDAPGCFSAADEMDDLFANAAEALALWTEAMIADRQEIPAPLWGLRWHGHESLRLPPSLRAKRSNPDSRK